jgi:hypothetical protein
LDRISETTADTVRVKALEGLTFAILTVVKHR